MCLSVDTCAGQLASLHLATSARKARYFLMKRSLNSWSYGLCLEGFGGVKGLGSTVYGETSLIFIANLGLRGLDFRAWGSLLASWLFNEFCDVTSGFDLVEGPQ